MIRALAGTDEAAATQQKHRNVAPRAMIWCAARRPIAPRAVTTGVTGVLADWHTYRMAGDAPDWPARQNDRSFVMPFPLLILAASPAPQPAPAPAAATAPRRPTVTDTYRARYRGHGDVYCIRIFADPAPAMPYPHAADETCQTRTQWTKDGLTITDPRRDIAVMEGPSWK